MPKIIENLQQKLIAEAGRQIAENGYGTMTVRSVAKACGVGVGTVYNYFPSKDALVAAYMLGDWKECIAAIQAVSDSTAVPEEVLRCSYEQLLAYSRRHGDLFRDEAAAAAYAGSFGPYHSLLRSQLARPVRKFCTDDFASEFIAEALLTWTVAGKPFDALYGMIGKLF